MRAQRTIEIYKISRAQREGDSYMILALTQREGGSYIILALTQREGDKNKFLVFQFCCDQVPEELTHGVVLALLAESLLVLGHL